MMSNIDSRQKSRDLKTQKNESISLKLQSNEFPADSPMSDFNDVRLGKIVDTKHTALSFILQTSIFCNSTNYLRNLFGSIILSYQFSY
jgi:hypothetical protein